MITKLTLQEKEELFSVAHIATRIGELQSIAQHNSIEWYKQTLDKDSPLVLQRQANKLGNEYVVIHAIFITPVSVADIRHQRETRNPLFVRRSTASPQNKVQHINFTLLCTLEERNIATKINQTTLNTYFIPALATNHFQQLKDESCLGTLFNTQGAIIFPGEVGLDIPFFKGTQRLHQECLKHGRIRSKKPLPKNLLDGAVWYNTEQQPL